MIFLIFLVSDIELQPKYPSLVINNAPANIEMFIDNEKLYSYGELHNYDLTSYSTILVAISVIIEP